MCTGVFQVQEPMAIWPLKTSDTSRVSDIVRHLLARGSQSLRGLEKLKQGLLSSPDWHCEKIKSYKDTCDACKLKRYITCRITLGRKQFNVGKHCYNYMQLAHMFLHHKHLKLDIQDLFDSYEELLTKTYYF